MLYIIFNLYIPKGWKLYSASSCESKPLSAAVLVLAAHYKMSESIVKCVLWFLFFFVITVI